MSALMIIHLILMLLAVAVFAWSFTIGLLFLAQEGVVKGHRPLSGWLARLPALEVMDGRHYRVLSTGFVLLTAGMLSGVLLNRQMFGHFFSADPRQIASVVTWGIYFLFLNVRIRSGWRGRRGILLSLLGFLTVALTFVGIHHRGG